MIKGSSLVARNLIGNSKMADEFLSGACLLKGNLYEVTFTISNLAQLDPSNELATTGLTTSDWSMRFMAYHYESVLAGELSGFTINDSDFVKTPSTAVYNILPSHTNTISQTRDFLYKLDIFKPDDSESLITIETGSFKVIHLS